MCDRDEFENLEDVKDFFGDRRHDPIQETTTELLDSVLDCLHRKDLIESIESFTAETEAELNTLFSRISGPSVSTSEDGRRTPALWPLILDVTVHQDRDLLKAGVVLADMPGITDTDRSIVQASKSYLKRAGTILVFAHPSRIVQNPELEANLRECIGLGKIANIRLLVTAIDQKSLFKDSEKAKLSPDDQGALREAEESVQKIKADVKAVAKEKVIAKDIDQFRALDERLQSLELEEILAGRRVKQTSVEIRNRMIERDMRGKLRDLTGSKKAPDLPVFFISNTEYQKHLAGYERKDPPTLDLAATGIPEVRRMLYNVPARGKVNTLSRICEQHMPTIFSGILGILSKSHLERKQEVEKLINRILEEDEHLVEGLVDEVHRCFKERIIGAISKFHISRHCDGVSADKGSYRGQRAEVEGESREDAVRLARGKSHYIPSSIHPHCTRLTRTVQCRHFRCFLQARWQLEDAKGQEEDQLEPRHPEYLRRKACRRIQRAR